MYNIWYDVSICLYYIIYLNVPKLIDQHLAEDESHRGTQWRHSEWREDKNTGKMGKMDFAFSFSNVDWLFI